MSSTPQVTLTEQQQNMINEFVKEMQRAQLFNLKLRENEVIESTKLAAAKRRVQEG